MTYWTGLYRTAAETGLWWTQRWLQAPTFFSAWAIARAESDAVMETARTAAGEELIETAQFEEAAPEGLDAVVEAPIAVAQEAAAAVEAAVDVVTGPANDLTQLVGIGPKLAAALAERGVTRFAQIAAWTAGDLAEVDLALSLKGRAVRDSWVAQAKRLAAQA